MKQHSKAACRKPFYSRDRYAAHFKTVARHHQVCTAHLLRDFNYIDEIYGGKCTWAGEFKGLLHQSLQLKKGLSAEDYTGPNQERQQLYGQLQGLLGQPLEVTFKKAVSLQKKLRKIRGCILSFLEYPDVPPDNNGSERAIRNVKVKQKISGQYRSLTGADTGLFNAKCNVDKCRYFFISMSLNIIIHFYKTWHCKEFSA